LTIAAQQHHLPGTAKGTRNDDHEFERRWERGAAMELEEALNLVQSCESHV